MSVDFISDYRMARQAAAWIERSDRALFRVFGREPLKMVQNLVTNDVAGAPPDHAVYAAFLTPKGKMVAEARVIRREGELWIDTAALAADSFEAHWRKYVPPLFARCEPVSGVRVLGVYGPAAARVVQEALARRQELDETLGKVHDVEYAGSPLLTVSTDYTGDPGYDLVVPADILGAVQDRLTFEGARPIDLSILEVLRIEASQPRWGAELSEDVIPLEAGLRATAISETKGCYTGQEVIVRILHRGHVNRHLRGVLLGSAPVAAANAELRNSDGKVVGRITSACSSPRFEQTIALAYVRREVAPQSKLRLGEHEALVVELPLKPAPKPVEVE